MLNIRPAATADINAIIQILDEADLRYPGENYDGFWLAEKAGRVVGVVRLEEHPDFSFLTSLGVANDSLHQGTAKALLNQVSMQASKPIYLYTIIPEFFRKFGFVIIPRLPSLPAKSPYGCNKCFPDQCVTMVK